MKKGIIILLSTVILLSGCKLTNFFKSEKDRFIGATSEALCKMFTFQNPTNPSKEESAEIKAVYSNYGFSADDEAGMKAIADKYEKDQEVKDVITKALKECSRIDINAQAPADTVPATEVAPETPAVTPAK